MRTLGVIGGLSWTSTELYYRLIHQRVHQRLGGLHAPHLLLDSLAFHEVEALQRADDWEPLRRQIRDAGLALEGAGAEVLILATNTMHKVADQLEAALTIPFIHIADPTADAILAAGLGRVGLLGTRFTMGERFYLERLASRGVEALVPASEDQVTVDRIIFEELVRDVIRDDSRQRYREVIARLVDAGAEGIILGCTEIGLLVAAADCPVPTFDTAALHAQAAADAVIG